MADSGHLRPDGCFDAAVADAAFGPIGNHPLVAAFAHWCRCFHSNAGQPGASFAACRWHRLPIDIGFWPLAHRVAVKSDQPFGFHGRLSGKWFQL